LIIFYLLCFVGAYLLGSVSSAILVCKAFGLPDPREEGSGNPGATNVLRLGGKKLAAMVFLGDALKGLIPVLLVHLMIATPWVVMTTALCAFLGHLYPVFFNFKGGKGVATYVGCLFGASLWLGSAAALLWVGVAAVTRFSSLSALVMAAVMPLVVLVYLGVGAFLPLMIMSALLFYRHWTNIQRLLAGEEPKIGH
jgi:acyl phosphate:glycerol-3-phosphate acyltransferase